jgi:hypothetical protein
MKITKSNFLKGVLTGAAAFLMTATAAFAQGNNVLCNQCLVRTNDRSQCIQECGGANGNIQIARPAGFFLNFNDFGTVVLRLVFVIAAILVFGYLVLGGIEWITSGGDKSKTESARNKITAAIVGFVILVASWALMSLVIHFVTQGAYSDLNDILRTL